MKICKFMFFVFITIVILISINCSVDKNSEESSIDIKKISFNEVQNRSPKESSYQVEIELQGLVSDQNLKQNIQFKWYVEYLNLDIGNSKTTADSTDDQTSINNNYKQGYYFLDVANNSLNALLTIYRPGYYKITLQGSNAKEIKENTIIIKEGEIELPDLYVKINTPELNKLENNDFKGKFYLQISENNKINSAIINAKELKSNWYNTGIKLNPFADLKINSGSYLIDNKTKDLLSITSESNADYLTYKLNNNDVKIDILPIVLNNLKNSKELTINKNGQFNWIEGEVYISILKWASVNNTDEFIYREKTINKNNYNLNIDLNNDYLVKIFMGPMGHKVYPNNYFIFFGPEGTNIEELDPKNQRELTSLPYGYLLGKLGDKGAVFPIGLKYTQNNRLNNPVYIKDKNGLYIIQN